MFFKKYLDISFVLYSMFFYKDLVVSGTKLPPHIEVVSLSLSRGDINKKIFVVFLCRIFHFHISAFNIIIKKL